jgi:DNA polymerase elongation subunit (family B)
LKLILEDDRTYIKILLAAPKNYAGLSNESPKPDIKGMTGNKRSMPTWGREVFNGVVSDFFGNPDKIEDPRPRITEAIEDLETGKVPLSKLKKWERLDQDPSEYKNAKDPKKIYGLAEDLEEDDKIWYYLGDKKLTQDNVSFTRNPAEIDIAKYKKYLHTATEPFLKALGDSKEDIDRLFGVSVKIKRKKKKKPQVSAQGGAEAA